MKRFTCLRVWNVLIRSIEKVKINLTLPEWYWNKRLRKLQQKMPSNSWMTAIFFAGCSQTFQLTNWKWVHVGAMMAAVADCAFSRYQLRLCGFNAKNGTFAVKVVHAWHAVVLRSVPVNSVDNIICMFVCWFSLFTLFFLCRAPALSSTW